MGWPEQEVKTSAGWERHTSKGQSEKAILKGQSIPLILIPWTWKCKAFVWGLHAKVQRRRCSPPILLCAVSKPSSWEGVPSLPRHGLPLNGGSAWAVSNAGSRET